MTTTLRIESVPPEPRPSPPPPPRRSKAVLAFLMVCSFLAGCMVTYLLMSRDDEIDDIVLRRIDEYLWLASGHKEPRYGSLGFPQNAEEATLISQLRKRGDFYQRVSESNSRIDGPLIRRGTTSNTYSVYALAYTAGTQSKGQWFYQPKTDLLPQDTKASERVIELTLTFNETGEKLAQGVTPIVTDTVVADNNVRMRAITLDPRRVNPKYFGSYPLPGVVINTSGAPQHDRPGSDLLAGDVKHVICQLPRHKAADNVQPRTWLRTTAGWFPREWMHKGAHPTLAGKGRPSPEPMEGVIECSKTNTMYTPRTGTQIAADIDAFTTKR